MNRQDPDSSPARLSQQCETDRKNEKVLNLFLGNDKHDRDRKSEKESLIAK